MVVMKPRTLRCNSPRPHENLALHAVAKTDRRILKLERSIHVAIDVRLPESNADGQPMSHSYASYPVVRNIPDTPDTERELALKGGFRVTP